MASKPVTHFFEAVGTWGVYYLFKAMPVGVASAIGGWLGRHIGYHFGVSKIARKNLARAFPEKTAAEREEIIRGVWDNLGRLATEFPNVLDFMTGDCIETEGVEYIEELKRRGGPAIFVTAHTGNWELTGPALMRMDVRPMTVIYRNASNPLVDKMFSDGRAKLGVTLSPKGMLGARTAVAALKDKGFLGLLVDQKMNSGIEVPFFGRGAMTGPALAIFALKFNAPIIPARVIRVGGSRFRFVVEKPLEFPEEKDRDKAVLQIMTMVNQTFERWIREYPEQWLWLHNRWPSDN